MHHNKTKLNKTSYLLMATLCSSPALATNEHNKSLKQLKSELLQLKSNYQHKINQLEEKLTDLTQANEEAQNNIEALAINVSQQTNQKAANTFNPSVGMILNGRWVSYSNSFNDELAGFFPAKKIGIGEQGFQLGESELNLKANVDDKFYASSTLAFGDGVEVEEAFIQTLSLGHGFTMKAGRFFSDIGYLNNKHSHTDNFANRPLPYQAFLGGKLSDDGIQITWLAPTTVYWESGAELYRGESFPATGAANSGLGTWTIFSHIGGDINRSQSWRAGISYLHSDVENRNNDNGAFFSGSSKLLIADFIYKWAPQGNRTNQELTLQGEYFSRTELGLFSDNNLHNATLDQHQQGWYLASVYRFSRQWRVGLRHAKLTSDKLDNIFNNTLLATHSSPKQHSVMLDWTNSEFSRIRLQYDLNKLNDQTENSWTLQYIAAFGAHGAHSY